MGKTTGFIEYNRALPAKRSVAERLKDYNEFVLPYETTQLNQQAARCMNCGVPFCHNGCPLGNVIPAFNDAVFHQNWKAAYEILSATNNFLSLQVEFVQLSAKAPVYLASINLP
jgi:glutamate synthase (NADPH/NADH) small chain